MGLHRDLTGNDLHVNKLHAETHAHGGADPMTALTDWANIKDYGALNLLESGVDPAADSTVAILAALAAIPAAGGVLYIPAGKYRFTQTLSIPGHITIVGQGHTEDETNPSACTLLKDGNIDGIIFVGHASVIRDITLDATNDVSGRGIVVHGNQFSANSCMVVRQGGDGLVVGDATAHYNVNHFALYNVHSRENGGRGIVLISDVSNASDTNAGIINGGSCLMNTGDGYYFKNSGVNTFIGLEAEQNGGIGIHCDSGTFYSTFLNEHSEVNDVGGTTDPLKQFVFESGTHTNLVLTSDTSYVVDNGTNTVLFAGGGSIQQLILSRPLTIGNPAILNFVGSTQLNIAGDIVAIELCENDAAADNKLYDILQNAGNLSFRLIADNLAIDPILTFVRTGMTGYWNFLMPVLAQTITATQFRLSALNTAPANAGATGVLGEIRIVDGFIYVCTATNTWKRAAITTWT